MCRPVFQNTLLWWESLSQVKLGQTANLLKCMQSLGGIKHDSCQPTYCKALTVEANGQQGGNWTGLLLEWYQPPQTGATDTGGRSWATAA